MSEESKSVSYMPTDGLSYDPEDDRYWNKGALDKEVTRAFEICHGCRMCFKYCDSFPILFDLLDKRYDGDVRKVKPEETARVMDACFQCKLCEVQCPYTVRDGHEYQLDFPKLVHRYKAQRAKTLPRKLKGEPLWTAAQEAGLSTRPPQVSIIFPQIARSCADVKPSTIST